MRASRFTFADLSGPTAYDLDDGFMKMTRRMPYPEEVSREHIDVAVVGFLKGDKDLDWTEVSLVTLHPREEIRVVLKDSADRYRTLNADRFRELLERLRSQGVALQAAYK